MNKLFIEDLANLKGKRVLMRVDFNVPLNENQEITSESRIDASLPSITYLMGLGAKTILMSHLGRPKGPNPKESRKPVAVALSKKIGKPVSLVPDCVGSEAEKAVRAMQDGDVVLLENLRFHPQEKKNDPGFAGQLASLGALYVKHAFGTAHRAPASTEGVTRFF